MNKELFKLEDIIEPKDFQNIQNDISKATEMAIVTVDFKGVPFTGHSESSQHCQMVRKNPTYRDLCQKCDSRGGLEAARKQKPYIYICHRGLVDLAVPIIVKGQYVGAMMAGQVRLSQPFEEDHLERMIHQKNTTPHPELDDELEPLFLVLPAMRLEKVEAIAAMLFHITKYMVDSALLRLDHMTQPNHQVATDHKEVSKTLSKSETLLQAHMNFDFLKPALVFLDKNTHQHVTLEEMAALCNVSSSYFSKSFNKVTGMSFSGYQNTLKIQRAEKLLRETHLSINEIADQLAYEHVSYFIKLFKKQTRVTPGQYRKKYHEKHLVDLKIK